MIFITHTSLVGSQTLPIGLEQAKNSHSTWTSCIYVLFARKSKWLFHISNTELYAVLINGQKLSAILMVTFRTGIPIILTLPTLSRPSTFYQAQGHRLRPHILASMPRINNNELAVGAQ